LDFGDGEVIVAGQLVKAQLFLMWLGHSSATIMKAYPVQTLEIYFDGHVSAFDFFGGVPGQVWCDNLKTAVDNVLEGRNRQEQEAFVSFRSHYLLRPASATPASSGRKGDLGGGLATVAATDSCFRHTTWVSLNPKVEWTSRG
jgi:transposase